MGLARHTWPRLSASFSRFPPRALGRPPPGPGHGDGDSGIHSGRAVPNLTRERRRAQVMMVEQVPATAVDGFVCTPMISLYM